MASTVIDEHAPSVMARYYALPPAVRLSLRWVLIAAGTAVAFGDSIVDIAHTASLGVIGGYVWVVPAAAILAAIGVARRDRTDRRVPKREAVVSVKELAQELGGT